MKNRKFSKLYFMISAIVLVVWLVFIFGMSAKSGEESAGISYNLATLFYRIPLTKMIFKFDTFHTIIRKLAHFTEYGILGLLVINFINSCGFAVNRLVVVCTSIFCCIYAGLDEYHQSFVDGRGPSVRDVIIDTSGAIFFLLVFIVVKGIVNRSSVISIVENVEKN